MKHSILLIFTTTLFLFFLSSCEYELEKENFRELHPVISASFNLNLSPERDTFNIFNTSEFSYNIETWGLAMLGGYFTIGDTEWDISSDAGKFIINPVIFPPGYDTLCLTVITNSGTGSLADHLKMEGFIAQRKWLFLIDGRPAPVITASWSVTDEGFLKVSWPVCNQFNLSYYELTGSIGNLFLNKKISDPSHCFYIDSCFVGGQANFRINSRVITNNQGAWGSILNLNLPYPQLLFEDLGVDSLRIFWDRSKFNARYKLADGSKILFESSDDTTFTIANPGFGINKEYTLYTYPDLHHKTDTLYTRRDIKKHTLGQNIAGNWPTYGYNHADRVVYTNTYDDILCHDISNMTLLRTFKIKNLSYQGQYSCPTNSSKVAALSSEGIYIFDNKSLQAPVFYQHNSFGNSVDHFYLCDNDIVAIAQPVRYQLISIPERKLITTIPITDYPVYSKWACFSTSKDAKFASVVTLNGIKIYNIENGNDSLIYSDSRIYRSVLFDINNPERMFITFNDNNLLEIRNASDFSLADSYELPTNAQVLRNTDPETGYLLLTDYKNVYVFDPAGRKIVFSMKSSDNKPQLYGNRLFSNSGYTLDIKNYLP